MRTFLLAYFILGLIGNATAHSRELSLAEAFSLAEKNDPNIKAGTAQVAQAESAVSISKSGYFPTLDLGALDSTGFPGSTGSSLGIGGLISSPFRSGPAVGVFSKLTVFDRERDYGVDVAHWNLKSLQERTGILRQRTYQITLETFTEASRLRAQMETWKTFVEEAAKVSAQVKKLVRTGQHSPVSLLLVQDQVDDANMKWKVYQERYQEALTRVALLVGLPSDSFDCPPSQALDENSLNFLNKSGTNPLITRAKADVESAQSATSQSFSQLLPKIFAAGSAGWMSSARLVAEQNYAAAVGIDLPIFEGFRVSSDIQRSRAALEEKKRNLDAVQLEVDETASRYEEAARSSRVQLESLSKEKINAVEALKEAQVRYVSYRGLLVDVREALRNLIRIQSDINDAKANLVLALGSKDILEGAITP